MSDYIYNPESGELYHYGVKGMKWGVRKKPEERYVSVRQARKNAAKASTNARLQTHIDLNNSPKKHSRIQYEVAKGKAGRAASKASYDADIQKNYELAKKRAGDTSKSARNVSEYRARYIKKSNEIDQYRRDTAAARKQMGLGKRFIQSYKDEWNQPAMTITGKDSTYGKEYVKGYLASIGTIAVATYIANR